LKKGFIFASDNNKKQNIMKIKAIEVKVGDFLVEAKCEITEIIRKPLKNGKDAYVLVVEKNGLVGSYYKKAETMVSIVR
jgi:hypothetical protein